MIRNLLDEKKLISIIPILITIFIFLIIYFFPLPRQIGLSFRYDLGIIVIVLFPLAAIFLYPKNLFGNITTAIFVAVIFALPLSGLWASGQTEPYILFGLIPNNDALGYYQAALRFISGNIFIGASADRPMAPAFLSLLLRITDQNLQLCILIQTILCAIASIYLIRFIRNKWSTLPASIFLVLLFLFYRQFVGSVLTENAGLFFGLLGFVLLLGWCSNRQNRYLFLGVLLVTLALNTRAGAYFILLSLILITILFKKLVPRNSLLIIILGIMAGFIINISASVIYSGKIVFVGSNFLDNLYQLVTNSESWRSLTQTHPEALRTDTLKIIQIIIGEFIKDPTAILKGTGRSFSELFSLERTGAFGFLEGERIHSTKWSVMVGSLILYTLSTVGVVRESLRFRKLKDLTSIMLLFSLAGIILSAPFIFPGDYSGMRFFAATISFQIIFPVLGMKFLLEKLPLNKFFNEKEEILVRQEKTLFQLSLLFVLIILFGLLLNAFARKLPQLKQITCEENEVPVAFNLSKGSYVNILSDDEVEIEWLPDIGINRARLSSHGLSSDFSAEFELLDPPFSITSSLNYYSGLNVFLVFAPSEFNLLGNYEICAVKPKFPSLKESGFLFTHNAFKNN